jgi:hypothetical protein
MLTLSPGSADSTLASVQLLFKEEEAILWLLKQDRSDNCCLEPATTPACSVQCRVECRAYTPGRQHEHRASVLVDATGKPSCALPTYNNANPLFKCSAQVQYLEFEVLLDSYYITAAQPSRFGCRQDTTVTAPSVPFQVLYQIPESPHMQQRVVINGTNFFPGLNAADASCIFAGVSGTILSTNLEYRPMIQEDQIHCLVDGSRLSMGALRIGTTYSVKYKQGSLEHATQYHVLVLARPRLLGVRSRLVSQDE